MKIARYDLHAVVYDLLKSIISCIEHKENNSLHIHLLRQHAAQLGLAHARGAREEHRGDGAPAVAQTRPGGESPGIEKK